MAKARATISLWKRGTLRIAPPNALPASGTARVTTLTDQQARHREYVVFVQTFIAAVTHHVCLVPTNSVIDFRNSTNKPLHIRSTLSGGETVILAPNERATVIRRGTGTLKLVPSATEDYEGLVELASAAEITAAGESVTATGAYTKVASIRRMIDWVRANTSSVMSLAWTAVTGKPATATRWPTWGEVTGKPGTFPPAAHNQAWNTISDRPFAQTPITPTATISNLTLAQSQAQLITVRAHTAPLSGGRVFLGLRPNSNAGLQIVDNQDNAPVRLFGIGIAGSLPRVDVPAGESRLVLVNNAGVFAIPFPHWNGISGRPATGSRVLFYGERAFPETSGTVDINITENWDNFTTIASVFADGIYVEAETSNLSRVRLTFPGAGVDTEVGFDATQPSNRRILRYRTYGSLPSDENTRLTQIIGRR